MGEDEPARCRFFGTAAGCRAGSSCLFLHRAGNNVPEPTVDPFAAWRSVHARQPRTLQVPRGLPPGSLVTNPARGPDGMVYYFSYIVDQRGVANLLAFPHRQR